MDLTYEEILNFEDLNDFKPDQIVLMLGIIFETGHERKNADDIRTGLKFAEKQNFEKFTDHDKMIFHYNVANGWFYLQILTREIGSDEYWAFEFEELEEQIINLRLALNYSKSVKDDFNKCQILTNLGNLFSHIGRFSEAQIYWQLVQDITPSFPMAIGNIGFGLAYYAKVLYDEGQQALFFKLSYKYLNQAITGDIYQKAKEGFKNTINALEEHFDKEWLSKLTKYKDSCIGKTKSERQYHSWCLRNRLFLNPINDTTINNVAAHDCLLLPTMRLKFDEPPIYQTIYNQIKQEFVSARFLLYESMNIQKKHFSDKGNLQMDILDYAVYSYSSEKLKIVYRVCYSILDKIGYLLNEYLDLGIKPEKVTYKKIWYKYNKKGEITGLNDKVTQTKNWAFRGLYWLSKDLYEKDMSYLKSIEPDSKELALIRNFIEHKSFKIVDVGETRLTDNDLTYEISRFDFEDKTLKLFKLIRAAMIYLSLGINIEEQKKDKNELSIPIDFIELRDEYKI